MKRIDKEIRSGLDYGKYKKFEILDWPSYHISVKNLVLRVLEKINRMFGKYLLAKQKQDTTFGYGVLRDKDYLINQGVEFISQYDLVVSTRLHGHILALLLGIPSIIIDNSYGKNSRFYNTWLKDISNSKLVSNNVELDKELTEFQRNS